MSGEVRQVHFAKNQVSGLHKDSKDFLENKIHECVDKYTFRNHVPFYPEDEWRVSTLCHPMFFLLEDGDLSSVGSAQPFLNPSIPCSVFDQPQTVTHIIVVPVLDKNLA